MGMLEEDEDKDWGCLYPGKCLMPDLHFESECHTAEDMEAYYGNNE